MPRVLQPLSPSAEPKLHPIWVVNHGWHTGIIIERAKIAELIPTLGQDYSGKVYLEVGWGDAGFYRAGAITPALIVQAIAIPTIPVLHVAGFSEHPGVYFKNEETAMILLSKKQHSRLLKFVSSSFASHGENKIISLGKGIYGHSTFYRATGRYHAFNTCNHWTAKALHSAGIPIFPPLASASDSVMNVLDNLDPSHFRRQK
jgi:uncharacterized protein (TIGR02117 family)